ncbi:MAG TPA: hypothetical protein VNG53_04040 [Bacteroidia bacterium]|nr:hypothetical protein [Bacteroidia bacterium]
MQIIIIIQRPKSLKISFVYTRTKSIADVLDECICDFAKRLSGSFSTDSLLIDRYSNVNIENFVSISYNTIKNVNLIFQCFNKETNQLMHKQKTFDLTLYFDSADKDFINNFIGIDYFIQMGKKDFSLLNTLTTY